MCLYQAAAAGALSDWADQPWEPRRRAAKPSPAAATTPSAMRPIAPPVPSPPSSVIVERSLVPDEAAAAGVLYARAKRAPLVVNVADRWPASAVQLGALGDRRAIAAAEALERWCYRHAAAVTVSTQGLESDLAALPEAAGKVQRIGPAVDLERFAGLPRAGSRPGPLRLLYAGTIGMAQGLDTLVEAAARAGPQVVVVRIAGGGAEEAQVRAAVERLDAHNVELLGVVPADRVPALYAWADAGAVLLRDRPIFAAALSTKLLDAMAAARPVLFSGRGEAAELVRRAGAGLVAAPEDPAALAGAIAALANDRRAVATMGAAGRATAVEGFSRPAMIDRWETLVRQAAAPRRVFVPLPAPSCNTTGRVEAARAKLREAIDKEPRSFVGYVLLGDLELRAGRAEVAEALYRRALELNPVDVGLAQLVELARR